MRALKIIIIFLGIFVVTSEALYRKIIWKKGFFHKYYLERGRARMPADNFTATTDILQDWTTSGHLPTSFSTLYSPVTLNNQWSKLARLVFIVSLTCLGTIINGFFVAAFFVEDSLRKVGNVYLAFVGLSDMVITSVLMPTSAVVLLSGEWDSVTLCRSLYFLAELATYAYSLFFMFVGAETYFRLSSRKRYLWFISMRAEIVCSIVLATSIVAASLGVFMDLDYDYCERRHYGHIPYRYLSLLFLHILPGIMTMGYFVASIAYIRKRSKAQVTYRRSQQFEKDRSTTYVNIVAFLMFLLFWTPYIYTTFVYPFATEDRFYQRAWAGLSRSVMTSILYCAANENFKRAFVGLFYYCCCKSSLSGSLMNRHRRAVDYRPAMGEVRVHIMHQAVNTVSPQRTTSAGRETQDL